MSTHRPVALVAAGIVALGAVAATDDVTDVPPTEPCAAVEGAEGLSLHGTTESFRGGTPDPTSIVDQGIGDQTGLADASTTEFRYVLDVAPAEAADVRVTLDWTEPTQPRVRGDYDLYVLDADGNVLGEATGDNLLGGILTETVSLNGVDHCTELVVQAKNWLGTPGAEATLDIGVSDPAGHPVTTLCDVPDGAAPLLPAGTGEAFTGGTPDPTSIVDQSIGDDTGLAAASVVAFPYVVELPSQYASVDTLRITLDWTEPTQPRVRGDYDLHVYDAEGNEIGASTGDNLLGGALAETVALNAVPDCMYLEVHAKNWLGTPGASATLEAAPASLTAA